MKESKNKQNQAVEQDQDKTGFEKMEDEVKGTIFNVLYVLLKEEETSHWKHIVLILFDFIQIFYFTFSERVTTIINFNCIDGFSMEVWFNTSLCASIFGFLLDSFLDWKTRLHDLLSVLLYLHFHCLPSHSRHYVRLLQFYKKEIHLRMAFTSLENSMRIDRDSFVSTFPRNFHNYDRLRNRRRRICTYIISRLRMLAWNAYNSCIICDCGVVHLHDHITNSFFDLFWK